MMGGWWNAGMAQPRIVCSLGEFQIGNVEVSEVVYVDKVAFS